MKIVKTTTYRSPDRNLSNNDNMIRCVVDMTRIEYHSFKKLDDHTPDVIESEEVRMMALDILFWQDKFNDVCKELEKETGVKRIGVLLKSVEDLIQSYFKRG